MSFIKLLTEIFQKLLKFSKMLKFLSQFFDFLTLACLMWSLNFHDDGLILYSYFCWVIISFKNTFYKIYSHTTLEKLLSLIIAQFFLFSLFLFAYLGIFNHFNDIFKFSLAKFLVLSSLIISFFKISLFFIRKKFVTTFSGSKLKNVVILGKNKTSKQLAEIFYEKDNQFGFKLLKEFDFESKKFNWEIFFKYIVNNDVDQIFCSTFKFSNEDVRKIINFTDSNIKTLKFIPENVEIYPNKMSYDYYGYIPVLNLRTIPFDIALNKYIKRFFDIVFSIFVLIFILSWLTPIIALFIKLESSGPIFFKQDRPGLNEKSFNCYKFRSMRINGNTETSAIKEDPRVTNFGKFIRKTSIDELPQFYNVLLGDMSVVGPRPHLWRQNAEYGKTVNKYMVRYFVKPGITGLAQVNGYRGEIKTEIDIINRIRYDVFYIENWSLILDLKIIVKTILNIIRGEENAY